MGLITWAKKVIGMIFKRQAEEDFNVESVVSRRWKARLQSAPISTGVLPIG